MSYEVPEPIINSPFDEPKQHWHIEEGKDPELRSGRRPAMYFYRDPKAKPDRSQQGNVGIRIELKLVNRIRERVAAWRTQGYPGVTRSTHELLHWWRRDGREKRLFFAQLEAVETIVFLKEASRQRPNIRVLAKRAEEVAERFDWAVSRAVSYHDLAGNLKRLAPHAALLTGAEPPPLELGFDWETPVPLPGSKQRFLIVSRETRRHS